MEAAERRSRCGVCHALLSVGATNAIASVGCDFEGCDFWACAPCAGFPTAGALTYYSSSGGKWYCPTHALTTPPDRIDADNDAFRRRCTVKNDESAVDACSRTISYIGWWRVMADPRVKPYFPIGCISAGTPLLDDHGVLYLPVPGISTTVTRAPARFRYLQDVLAQMALEPFAPGQTVRRKADGRIGRVLGEIAVDAPIVCAVDGRAPKVGPFWGTSLHDAVWMGLCYKRNKDVFVNPLPNETRAQRNRRIALMDRMLNEVAPATHRAEYVRIQCGAEIVFVSETDRTAWSAEAGDAAEEAELCDRIAFGF